MLKMYFSCKNYVIKLNTTKLILFTKKKKINCVKNVYEKQQPSKHSSCMGKWTHLKIILYLILMSV